MWKVSDAMLRIYKARMNIARRNVFFASICFNARLLETDVIPTMATDGVNVLFNPDFVMDKNNEPHIEGVFLHEVLHAAFLHVGRRDQRDPYKWNLACDFSINPLIKKSYQLPKGHLDDPQYHDLSPEEIYRRLPNNPQIDEGSGRMREATAKELAEAERSWRRAVHNAVKEAEKAGTLPGDVRRMLGDLFPMDKLDWRDLTRDMIRDAKSRVCSSWSRPNRRFLGNGTILPGPENDQIYKLVICLDTSGSITDDQVKSMKGEAMSLLDQELVNSVIMISTDTKVCSHEEVTTSEAAASFDLGRCGGGTQFDAAMEFIGNLTNIAGVIFMTDLQTSSFGKQPQVPVCWVDWTNSGQRAPYGVTTGYTG